MTIRKSACLFLLSAAGAICFGQGSISGKILTPAPDDVDVLEFVCAENEKDLAHTKSEQ